LDAASNTIYLLLTGDKDISYLPGTGKATNWFEIRGFFRVDSKQTQEEELVGEKTINFVLMRSRVDQRFEVDWIHRDSRAAKEKARHG